LHAAMRVFDGDNLVQLGYSDQNFVTPGEAGVTNVGTFNGITFQRYDPRIIIPVVAGHVYYVQVESAESRAGVGHIAGAPIVPPDVREIDQRRATGSYELLIHGMPTLNYIDDHINSETA